MIAVEFNCKHFQCRSWNYSRFIFHYNFGMNLLEFISEKDFGRYGPAFEYGKQRYERWCLAQDGEWGSGK